MNDSLKAFCYNSSQRVMSGLWQEVGIAPNRDYRPDGYNSARVMTLRLTGINPHHLPKIRGMRDQLTMWAGLDDKSTIRIGHSGHAILVEIPKPRQYWAEITIEKMQARHMLKRGNIATLGMGLQDEPMRLNFNEAAMAHVLITGQTRSGKTNTQRLIAWNIAHNTTPQDAQLIIFDVAKRGYNWQDFGSVANLAHPVITTVPESDAVLGWATAEIERRASQRQITPRLFLMVDELKALVDDSQNAAASLARIAAVGGEFGMHLILATQYPQVKMLGGNAELKRNITTRLCGKVDDANAAANALGLPDTGAETLQGYGDFLLKDFDGIARMTVAKVDDFHIGGLDRGEIPRLPIQATPTTRAVAIQQPKPGTDREVGVILANWGPYRIGIGKIRNLVREHCGYSISDDRARRLQMQCGRILYYAQKFADAGCIDDKGLMTHQQWRTRLN